MATYPDWSEVKWAVYRSEKQGYRVMPRPLSKGEMRPNEKPVAIVVGCSRATVLALLKLGIAPGDLQRMVGESAERQVIRTRLLEGVRNLYREWVADVKRRQHEFLAAKMAQAA